MSASATELQDSDQTARLEALRIHVESEILGLRDTARTMNDSYAHSGLTNPRGDRLAVLADGMEYVLELLKRDVMVA